MGSYTTKVAAPSPVRSTQRGLSHDLGSITIISVDIAKAILNITTVEPRTGSTAIVARITGSTAITVTRSDGGGSAGRFGWEVIEFV